MANTGSSINNGQQQVSIYPYQQLSSVYGNEELYGILTPGVYSAGVTIAIASGNITFTILAGTTLVFQRSTPDPLNTSQIDTIIGKIVLGANATYPAASGGTLAISSLQSPNSAYNVDTLYLVADWQYTPTSPTMTYASFSLHTASDIATNVKGWDGSSQNLLIVATILNQQTIYNSGSPSASMYHISYDYQSNRDALKREFIKNNTYRIDFDGNGRGVYVNAGHTLVGDSILYKNPAYNQSNGHADTTLPFNLIGGGSGQYGEGSTYSDRTYSGSNYSPSSGTPSDAGVTGGFIRPATGITSYYSNTALQTNSPLTITTSNASGYNQIDFLRLKTDEVLHTQVLVWESFIQPATTTIFTSSFDWTFGTMDYNHMNSFTTPSKLLYLSQFIFPLSGDGETLLIAIRPALATGQYIYGGVGSTLIPSTDNSVNTLWPESCIFPRADAIPQLGGAPRHKRWKAPVWQSADLGVF